MNASPSASTKPAIGLNQSAQFAHLHMASPVCSKSPRSKEKKWTAKQLLAEAAREPNGSRHVLNPQPPVWLKGSERAVLDRAEAWHAQATERGGKARRRRTSPSLACAVVSWPGNRQGWPDYRNDVIAFFERKLEEDRVCGVVEHLDESHLHIHIYFVPADGEDFGAVHPGYRARLRARYEPGNHVGRAFINAMKRWQDELHQATGEKHGLERMSVNRARVSRPEFLARKRDKEAEARAAKALERLRVEAEQEAAEIKSKAQKEAKDIVAVAMDLHQRALSEGREVQMAARALQARHEKFAREPAGIHAAEIQQLEDQVMQLKAQLEASMKANDAYAFREKQRELSESRGAPTFGPK